MKREDVPFLNQMIASLIEVQPKLEKAYEKKDIDGIDKIKTAMLEIQQKISEMIK